MPVVPPDTNSGGTTALTIAEVDGAPSVSANALIVSNGSLTDSGGGTATVVTGAGVGTATFSGAKAYATAAQSITHNTWTALTFETELYDTDAYHAAGTPSRMTIPTDGYYGFGANVSWSTNGTGQRFHGISFNGGTTVADYIVRQSGVGTGTGGGVPRHFNLSGQAYATANAYLEVYVYQDSGGTITAGGTSFGTASFWISRLGV